MTPQALIHGDVPEWPPNSAVWVAVATYAVSIVAALPLTVVIEGRLGGDGGLSAAGLLLYSALSGGGALLVVQFVAARTQPLRPAQLGLRLSSPAASVVWLVLAAAIVGAFGYFWAELTDLGMSLSPPVELTEQVLGPEDEFQQVQGFGLSGVTSALGRVVVPAIIVSLVTQGFVLPALIRWRGLVPAVAICAVLSGGLLGLAGSFDALIVPGLVLGAVMCGLYIATESIYPTLALATLSSGVVFAAAADRGDAATVVLAIGCAVAALAITLPFAIGNGRSS